MVTLRRWIVGLLLSVLLGAVTPACALVPNRSFLIKPIQVPHSNDWVQIPLKKGPGKLPFLRGNLRDWDGDDLRIWSKIRRRILRAKVEGSNTPAIRSLIVLNFLLFLYQTMGTVDLIRKQNPTYWPGHALSILTDSLLGSTNARDPLTNDFMFSGFLARRQPHRYLTAGFLHGNIIHLLLNLHALSNLPRWLETGLGSLLFVTTFLVSIVAGNIGHQISTPSRSGVCLGASGGICGIYGLMYVSLVKMGNAQSASRVAKGMLLLFLYGLLQDNVSNAGHIGGFVAGLVMGLLFAPSYKKSYTMNRKWSLEIDAWSRDYRQVMGFAINPTKRGPLPISALWAAGALLLATEPRFRSIPSCIVRGILRPGSLSGFKF